MQRPDRRSSRHRCSLRVGLLGLVHRRLGAVPLPAVADGSTASATSSVTRSRSRPRARSSPPASGLLGDPVEQALPVVAADERRPGTRGPCRSGSASATRTARRACRSRRGRGRTPRPPSRASPCARRSGGTSGRGRRTGSASCSCGSSMLKPTEKPPPSLAPRFAASITPGPAAGDDREAGLGEQPPALARPLVVGIVPVDSAPSRRR